eukprot:12400842-Alexandrium_andersonii.AAC.1
MSASLVGSEMCIRDRCWPHWNRKQGRGVRRCGAHARQLNAAGSAGGRPVSYTHLTLPTICSV